MFKIIFEKEAELMIDIFLEWYKNSFKRLYTDTWIENEYIFHNWYIENAIKIKEEIREKIRYYLLDDEVIWYRLYPNWEKSIKIYLKSFMLEVFFEEDIEEKIRFIEKIKINRK